MRREFALRAALAALCLALWFPLAAASQHPDIAVSPGTEISRDSPGDPHVETFLALNPRNPQNLLATSIAIENGKNASVVYASFDGGKTWKRARSATEDNKIFKGGDPIVYFDPQGTAFFGAIQGTPVGFLLSRSTDGGLTWGPPVTIPGGTYDREYLAFDHTGGKFNGRMYAGGAISVTEANGKRHNAIDVVFSTDGGRTFSPGHVIIGNEGGEDIFGITEPLVAPDGTLVVPFSALHVPASSSSSRFCGNLWASTSTDGGVTFLPASEGPAFCWANGYKALKSLVATQAAMDLTDGPYRGRIYLAFTSYDGKKYDVEVTHSSDLGKTWSSPVAVNDNTNTDSPANPAIAVNKDGLVGVVWNDRRNDPKNSCFRLYFSVSADGGDTFLPNVPASDAPTCPVAAANWPVDAFSFLDLPLDLSKEKRLPAIAMSGAPERWPNGGDTQGLVAGPDGVFHSAWINGDGASGTMELWYKEFSVDKNALPRSAASHSREDLSRQLTLDISQPQIDFTAHTLSVRVQLVNPLPVTVTGPFTVVLNDVQSSLKDLRVVNAGNGLPGKGAFWNFRVSGGETLQPKQKSEVEEFRWQFSGGAPDPPGEPLRAHFLILGQAKTH